MEQQQLVVKQDDTKVPFLAAMTFGRAADFLQCSCDECNECSGKKEDGSSSFVPEPIRLAIREHKRIKRETGVFIQRTQDRTLVAQQQPKNDNVGVALWQWTLPLNAEPLLEFGNANVYRLVWIQRLRQLSTGVGGVVLKSIGTGIVGSSSEESSRPILDDWNEGNVIFVPSQNGKAVGWIAAAAAAVPPVLLENSKNKNDNRNSERGDAMGPAVLHVAKVQATDLLHWKTNQQVADNNTNEEVEEENISDESRAFRTIVSICAQSLHTCSTTDSAEAIDTNSLPFYNLGKRDTEQFKSAVTILLQANKNILLQ